MISPLSPDFPYRDPGLKPSLYDPKQALMLLEEDGWSLNRKTEYLEKAGNPFEFSLCVIKESQIEDETARLTQFSFNENGILEISEICRGLNVSVRHSLSRLSCREAGRLISRGGFERTSNPLIVFREQRFCHRIFRVPNPK